jgi:Protein of unknown function (DUF2934)
MSTPATQLAYEEPITSETVDPSHERIAALAYAYWLESGRAEGADEQNWLKAEQALNAGE